MKNYFLMVWITLFMFGCRAVDTNYKKSTFDYEAAAKGEIDFHKNNLQEIPRLMSLETMFKDLKVRALAKAAGNGRIKTVEKLVSQGVDVNARGKKGVTPLFYSLRNSNLKGFNKLLELGADPNIIFTSSVMHLSARHKNIEFLKSALEHGGNPNLNAGLLGDTPLFETITTGVDRSVARSLLLKSGADINSRTRGEKLMGMSINNVTPVVVACGLLRYDIAYELLELGADYSIKDDNNLGLTDCLVRHKKLFAKGGYAETIKSLDEVIAWLSSRGVEIK